MSSPSSPAERSEPLVAEPLANVEGMLEATELATFEKNPIPMRPGVSSYPSVAWWYPPLVGLGFLAVCIFLFWCVQQGRGQPAPLPKNFDLLRIVWSIAFMLALFMGVLVLTIRFMPFLSEDRMPKDALIRRLQKRDVPWLRSSSPEKSWYILHLPRSTWYATKFASTADIAMLHVGDEAIEIEGDKIRYHIPLHSLLGCHSESFRRGGTPCAIVCLQFQTADGPLELCFRIGQFQRGDRSFPPKNHLPEQAESLCESILNARLKSESHG